MKLSLFTSILGIAITLLIGCDKSTDPTKSEPVNSTKSTTTSLIVCDVKNVVEDLPWLKHMEEQIAIDKANWGFEVFAVPYKGETILWVWSIYNTNPRLYHCNGEGVNFPIDPSDDPDALALTHLIQSQAICAYKVYGLPGISNRCQ